MMIAVSLMLAGLAEKRERLKVAIRDFQTLFLSKDQKVELVIRLFSDK